MSCFSHLMFPRAVQVHAMHRPGVRALTHYIERGR